MEIRPYREGDEIEILELDARELPSEWNARTLENWRWKFLDSNPAGRSSIWVAEHNGHLIAHFAAVPYRLKVFDREVIASHSIGALVDRRFQNRGLLKSIGDRLLRDLGDRGILCTWGFPNERAYEFEKIALGYRDLIRFDQWRIDRSDFPGNLNETDARPIRKFDCSFDELWRRCSMDYSIIVRRDSSYLNWRFLQRPDLEYFPFELNREGDLSGYIVLKLYREAHKLRGHILDLFARLHDSSTLSALIEGSLAFFRRRNVDEVTVWCWGSDCMEQSLKEWGFRQEPLQRPMILKLNDPSMAQKGLLDRSNWYFTMSDSTEIF